MNKDANNTLNLKNQIGVDVNNTYSMGGESGDGYYDDEDEESNSEEDNAYYKETLVGKSNKRQ